MGTDLENSVSAPARFQPMTSTRIERHEVPRALRAFVAGTLVATGLAGTCGAGVALAHDKIETLEVGDRVVTAAMLDEDAPAYETRVRPDWQVIDLEVAGTAHDGKRQVVALAVLRPPDWLDAEDPDGDGAFPLDLPELRLRGLAHVIQVRGPPTLAAGPGRVVLSTVVHEDADVVSLRLTREDDAFAAPIENPRDGEPPLLLPRAPRLGLRWRPRARRAGPNRARRVCAQRPRTAPRNAPRLQPRSRARPRVPRLERRRAGAQCVSGTSV